MTHKADKTIDSPSRQFTVEKFSDPTYIVATYRNLKDIQANEYLQHMQITGDWMREANCGKLVGDFSQLLNFSLSLRATAVNNLGTTIIKKIPYVVIAVVKSNSAFDNLATQTALNAAKSLYKKILDGRLFDTREEAIRWITNLHIAEEFLK